MDLWTRFTHAGGFFLYWILVYCTMCGVGLALETAVQVVTPKFMPFFLLVSVISTFHGVIWLNLTCYGISASSKSTSVIWVGS